VTGVQTCALPIFGLGDRGLGGIKGSGTQNADQECEYNFFHNYPSRVYGYLPGIPDHDFLQKARG
jgi:hypothetical protein